MEKILASEMMEIVQKKIEERQHMCKRPKMIQIPMIVSLDEYGRISGFIYPPLEDVLGKRFVDDRDWPFKYGQKVYHRKFQQVGTFLGVDELDPSSALVEFVEEDGYKEEKRVSLVLLSATQEN